MAIKDPLMFITIEEFKNWKGFNKLEFDDTTTPDNEIWFAISVASNNIDYLSGYSISKKWPETTLTEFTDEIQTATAHYVRFLLTKDSNYIRGQSSISQGGMTYSENNPTDPYFIVPEVFNCLRKIKEYPNITGFNLDVLPKRNDFFSNFYSNYAEDSPFTRYLELINLKTNDTRVKIYLKHPKHLIGTEVWIDTTGIKSFDNLTTIELFTKYFSNDTMKLVDGKEGQENKVISVNGSSGESLWEINKDNPNFIVPKDDKGIDVNGRRLIDVGTPTFLSDATTKEYVDKKQDKLIAGENITIDKNNKISATGGSTDLTDYYKKEEVDKKLEDKMDKDQFQYAFAINTIGTEIPNLETTDKTVAGAINELKQKIKDKKFSNDYFKYNTETNEISLHDEENSLLCKDLLENNEYKLLKTQNKKLLQAINEILEKQPQPSPSKDNWKEIGTREKNKWDNWQITYDFQENKHYRVYYSWSIYNPVYTIQEFIITNKKIPGVQIQTFNDSANAVYFINQTSLKGQINNQLTTKNYSLNWIFDKSNNLVAIYYNNWKNTNNIINDKINYSFSDWHNGTSIATDNSNVYNILKWSNYARDWNTFTNMYPTFSFINSYFKVSTSTGIESSPTLATNTAKIEQYKNPGNANVLFIAYINTKDGGGWGIEIALNLDLWHDNDNIYFQWYCFLNSSFGRMTYVNIALNNINFHNIMNN